MSGSKKITSYLQKEIIYIGLFLALVTGMLDVISGINAITHDIILLKAVLLPLSVTVSVFIVVYILSWLFIGRLLVKKFNLVPVHLAASFGVFLGIVFIMISINYDRMRHLYSLPIITILSLVVLASIGSAITYFFLTRIKAYDNYRRAINLVAILAPFLILETLIFLLLRKPGNYSYYMLSGGYIGFVLITIFLVYMLSAKESAVSRVLTFFTVLAIIIGPLMFFLTKQSSSASSPNTIYSANQQARNVILITIDTLRSDVLSAYGSEQVSTPNIDSLAEKGVLFENAFSSSPWTLPSFASIMTGLPPNVHLTKTSKSKLPEEFTTLAESMVENGYKTGGIGKNVFLLPEFNIDQGFQYYYFFPRSYLLVNSFGAAVLHSIFSGYFKDDASTTDITQLASRWLTDNKDQSFFLWVHYFDPHGPYAPPERFISPSAEPISDFVRNNTRAGPIRAGHLAPNERQKKGIRELYDAEVRYVDENIGVLIDTIKNLGLYDDLLIILTSDHGEEFWEHDGFEHGHSLYNELIKVPLIIKLPESDTGTRVGENVSTQSLMPTVLDIVGIDYNKDNFSMGSILPLMKGDSSDYTNQPVVSSSPLYFENKESVIFDKNKYIRLLFSKQDELYNLESDPGEKYPIEPAEDSEDIKNARNLLKNYALESKYLGKKYGITGGQTIVLDKETKEKLKALDYIQ